MSIKRSVKVAGLLKTEISDIVLTQLKDPLVGFITITDVVLSDDLKIAKVYFTTLGDEDQKKKSLKGLERARPFIQNALGARVRLRYLPTLRFYLDETLLYAERIDKVIEDIHMDNAENVGENQT